MSAQQLEACELGYSVGPKAIVRDVSLAVSAGELVALVGPNGAGKTTLVRLLVGLLRPTGGQVHLAGRELVRMRRRQVARRLALLPQDTYTEFMVPVRDVVSMGRYAHRRFAAGWGPEDERLVTTAMARAGVADLADRSVTTLSGGERQLVFLARALAQQPRFLILDEPTNNLDIGHQLRLMELLSELAAEGVAVVAVMHDLRLAAAWFPRLVLLARGRVAADGPTPEVVASAALARAFGVTVSARPRANGQGPVVDLEFGRPTAR